MVTASLIDRLGDSNKEEDVGSALIADLKQLYAAY
jgi:hypothetical protein